MAYSSTREGKSYFGALRCGSAQTSMEEHRAFVEGFAKRIQMTLVNG